MTFDRPQAITNANSKCLRVERVIADRDRPALDRMAIVAAIVREYEAGVPEWARPSEVPPEYRDGRTYEEHMGLVACDECRGLRVHDRDCESPHCAVGREEAEAAFVEPPC